MDIIRVLRWIVMPLAVISMFKSVLYIVLSTNVLAEPPAKYPEYLKAHCKPLWYGWVSIILNAIDFIFSYSLYRGATRKKPNLVLIALFGFPVCIISNIIAHIIISLLGVKANLMMLLNCSALVLSSLIYASACVHYWTDEKEEEG